MKNFFIEDKLTGNFQLFGPLHLSLIIILIIGIILLIKNKNKLENLSEKTKDKIRIAIVIIMFLTMLIYYTSKVVYGVYDWKVHLPFHFCYIAGFLFMYAIFFKKWNLYKISYFMSFMGPIPAIIWPELYRTFDCFIFYQYIITHHFFLLSSIFILLAYKQKIEKKDLGKAIQVVLGIYIFMAIFNSIFHTNYIFSSEIPPHVIELYPFLKSFNYPIIIIFITGLVMLFLPYIFAKYINKKK